MQSYNIKIENSPELEHYVFFHSYMFIIAQLPKTKRKRKE